MASGSPQPTGHPRSKQPETEHVTIYGSRHSLADRDHRGIAGGVPCRIRRESSSTAAGSAKKKSGYVRRSGGTGQRAGFRWRVMMAGHRERVTMARRRGGAAGPAATGATEWS
jgi:hypothetical protein